MKEGFLKRMSDITHTSEINIITLGDIIDNSNFKDANIFLKIDVEGAELDVLKGASKLLQSGEFKYFTAKLKVNRPLSQNTWDK